MRRLHDRKKILQNARRRLQIARSILGPAGATSMNILVIDDDSSLRRTLRMSLEVLGHHATEARDSTQALELLEPPAVRYGLARSPPGPGAGAGSAAATVEHGPGAARRRGDGLRHDRDGRRGHAPRGVRLSAQAVHAGPASHRAGPDRPRAAAAVARRRAGRADPQRRARSRLADRGAEDARGPRRGLHDGGHGGHDPHSRRKRHGQRRARPRDPRPQPAGRRPLRHGALPEPFRRTAGKRPVRPRAKGPLPARSATRSARSPWPKGERSFSTKSATCRWPCSPSSCGCCRSAATSAWARRRPGPAMSASWPPRTATWKRKSPPGGSARTCSTAST